eukprot:Ihof_evm1s479 gene=Ihof_evmTU1s479
MHKLGAMKSTLEGGKVDKVSYQPSPAFIQNMEDRLLLVCLGLVGHTVQVTTKDDKVYEGIFYTSKKEDGLVVVLKHPRRREKGTNQSTHSSDLGDTLIIPSSMFRQLVAVEVVDLQALEAPIDSFRTDMEISGGAIKERELKKWAPDTVGGSLEGDMVMEEGKWDQFAVNKEKFNVETDTYREEDYTTPLNRNAVDPRARARADRIAKEIMEGEVTNIHIAEERGKIQEADYDEEDRYSGVLRSSPTTSGKYIPPGRRQYQTSAKSSPLLSKSPSTREPIQSNPPTSEPFKSKPIAAETLKAEPIKTISGVIDTEPTTKTLSQLLNEPAIPITLSPSTTQEEATPTGQAPTIVSTPTPTSPLCTNEKQDRKEEIVIKSPSPSPVSTPTDDKKSTATNNIPAKTSLPTPVMSSSTANQSKGVVEGKELANENKAVPSGETAKPVPVKLNPAAKAFVPNPMAKSFVPGGATSAQVPPTAPPRADGNIEWSAQGGYRGHKEMDDDVMSPQAMAAPMGYGHQHMVPRGMTYMYPPAYVVAPHQPHHVKQQVYGNQGPMMLSNQMYMRGMPVDYNMVPVGAVSDVYAAGGFISHPQQYTSYMMGP